MAATPDEVLRLAMTDEVGRCLNSSMAVIRHCTEQLDDQQIWWRPAESMNSIGNLLLHLKGNLRQWVVTGLSELSDDRDRAAEFSQRIAIPKERLLDELTETVAEAIETVRRASIVELTSVRRIQEFDVTGLGAIFDAIPHFKGHTQEIVCLTRMQKGQDYRFRWKPSSE